MKKIKLSKKPLDFSERKKGKPVICYPIDDLTHHNFSIYQQARNEMKEISQVIIPPRDAKCLLVINKGKKLPRNELCPATNKKFKNCCGSL